MNGGALPLALLSVAIGLALGLGARSSAWLGFAASIMVALLISWLPVVSAAQPLIFAGLWVSAIATAALLYFPIKISRAGALAVGVNGGAWMGAFAGASTGRTDLVVALPFGLFFLLRRWLEAKGYVIVIKVLASWVMAIATLALVVSLMPTPGYVPDHME